MKDASLNVFGEPLILCGINPMTGVFRNGCCDTGQLDTGTHTVCALITDAVSYTHLTLPTTPYV